MKFLIRDKEYDAANIQSLTLGQIIEFDRVAKVEDLGITFADLEELNDRLSKMTDDERRREPASVLLLSITIWASRLAAGEKISYLDAIDIPMNDLVFIQEPMDDHKEAEKPDPRRARPVSGRAAKKRKQKASVSARSTSIKKSSLKESGTES